MTKFQKLEEARQLLNRGQADAALVLCREVLSSDASEFDALFLTGLIEAQRQNFLPASAAFQRAAQMDPSHALMQQNYGTLLVNMGELNAGLDKYNIAVTLAPESDDAWNARGNALTKLNRLLDAIDSYDRALLLNAARPDTLYSRATAFARLSRYDEAIASYKKAMALWPDFIEAIYSCGVILSQLGRYPEAVANFDRAITINGRFGNLSGLRMHTRMKICDWHQYEQELGSLLLNAKTEPFVFAPFEAVATIHEPSIQKVCIEGYTNRRFASLTVSSFAVPAVTVSETTSNKIRIGYFSADFHNHATAYLIAGIFEHCDKAKFEIVAYSFQPVADDAMTRRLELAFDRFVDISQMSDQAVVQLAHQNKLDIAVDLKGYTEHARPGIFARRAAPIQVNYLGFPGTMGASFMDYIVADKVVLPVEARRHYVEKPVYMPHSYQANDRQRPFSSETLKRTDHGLASHAFVFCCFNNSYKITPPIFDCWMRLLKQVDGSVLWLLKDNLFAMENLKKEAVRRGVSPARLVFAERCNLSEHLARHRLADLFLDTLPYNAHTTASDALWAGLPLLTCLGDTFAGRVAASLLGAVGLPELIAKSLDEYEEMAIALAESPEKLGLIRQHLIRKRLNVPLFDTALFTKHLEAAYLQMHQRRLAGLPPDDITV